VQQNIPPIRTSCYSGITLLLSQPEGEFLSMEIFGIIIPVGIFGAMAGFFGSWLRAVAMRKRIFQGEAVLLAQLRGDWVSLRPQWYKALLVALGPDAYYSPAPPEEKDNFRRLLSIMEEAGSIREYYNPNKKELTDYARALSHEYEQATRNVGMFLASLSNLVLGGRITPAQAYSVVGPDIALRSRQVRVMLGKGAPLWKHAGVAGSRAPWSIWAASLPGVTERIMVLIDIIWAESSRLGDAGDSYFLRASSVKNTYGSGRECRRRVIIHSLRSKSLPSAIKLSRHLLWSELLPFRYKLSSSSSGMPNVRFRGNFKDVAITNISWLGVFFSSLFSKKK